MSRETLFALFLTSAAALSIFSSCAVSTVGTFFSFLVPVLVFFPSDIARIIASSVTRFRPNDTMLPLRDSNVFVLIELMAAVYLSCAPAIFSIPTELSALFADPTSLLMDFINPTTTERISERFCLIASESTLSTLGPSVLPSAFLSINAFSCEISSAYFLDSSM